MEKVIYRSATVSDIPRITEIIRSHAKRGLMIEKSYTDILKLLPNFFVAEINGRVVGTCAFLIWLTGQVELISSAVVQRHHRKGIGKTLNKKCMRTAKELGFKEFIVLTGRDDFYKSLGFSKISKKKLDHKNMYCCLKCKRNKNGDPKFFLSKDCPEVAMKLTLS